MQFIPTQIIVHHDSVDRKGPGFDIVNAFHKQEGFPISSLGYYVGYHFWIENDGIVHQARRETEVGAHCKGQNYSGIGIGLEGNFDAHLPTDAQIASLTHLLDQLCTSHKIPAARIFPHRHYSSKTCYGSLLSDDWAQHLYLKFKMKDALEKLHQANPTIWTAVLRFLS